MLVVFIRRGVDRAVFPAIDSEPAIVFHVRPRLVPSTQMNMTSSSGRLLSLAAIALLAPLAFAQGPLTIGNLVAVRIGDATASGTSAACPMFLDEYTTAGTLVQSIPLPTTPSGLNWACTNTGTGTSAGQLNVSSNGLYLTVAGYDAPVGTATVATTPVATVRRVIARVDINGTVDTSTGLTDAYDVGNIRGVVSDDGLRFWTTGNVQLTGGTRFIANIGASTSIQVNSGSPDNCRQIGIFHGDLYLSAASGTTQGVAQVGIGLPTAPLSAPIAALPGFPTVPGPSSYDFYFANPSTLYVADDQTGGAGGIQKWVRNAGTWTKAYTLALNASTGCTGVTGYTLNGTTTLFATAISGNNTQIVTVVDNGAGSPVTSIAGVPAAGRLRGIRFLAKPSNTQRYPVGCGTTGFKVTGNAELGSDMFVSVTGSAFNFSLIGYGFLPAFVPFCNCTIAHEWQVFFAAQDHTLNISPAWGASLGLPIYVQAIDLLAAGGCSDPFLTLTDAAQFTVQ